MSKALEKSSERKLDKIPIGFKDKNLFIFEIKHFDEVVNIQV